LQTPTILFRYNSESDEVDWSSYVISQAFFYGSSRGATAVAAASTPLIHGGVLNYGLAID